MERKVNSPFKDVVFNLQRERHLDGPETERHLERAERERDRWRDRRDEVKTDG